MILLLKRVIRSCARIFPVCMLRKTASTRLRFSLRKASMPAAWPLGSGSATSGPNVKDTRSTVDAGRDRFAPRTHGGAQHLLMVQGKYDIVRELGFLTADVTVMRPASRWATRLARRAGPVLLCSL